MGDGLSKSFRPLAEVFGLADVRRLGLAYVASLIGLWAYGVCVSVYAFEIGGAALVGVATVIQLIPAAVVAPLAAVLADRYPRRRVMLSTDLTRSVLIAAAAGAIALDLPPVVVFVLAGVVMIVSTAFEPAKNAILPSLVERPEQLTATNVAMSTLESTSRFIGPALGGLMLAFASVQAAFAVTAALLLCSAALIARIGTEPPTEADPQDEKKGDDGMWAETVAGFRAIGGDWRLRTLIGLLGAQVLIYGALTVLTVAAAIDLLGMGRAGVGYLNSASGVGGLIGALATLTLTGKRGLGSLFGLGIFAWGAPIIVFGLIAEPVVALVMLGLVGAANTLVDTTNLTLLQRVAPERVLARVFGVMESVIVGALGVGALIAPLLISGFGIKGALIAVGVVLPVLALAFRPALARIDAEVPPPRRELDLLEAIPMFAPLGAVTLEQLAAALEPISFPQGAEIIRQGEAGERFYIIERGEVEVFEDARLARRQGAGEYFGEIALLRDIPRTANVVAIGEVETFALGRKEFLDAVALHPLSGEAAELVAATRLGGVRR